MFCSPLSFKQDQPREGGATSDPLTLRPDDLPCKNFLVTGLDSQSREQRDRERG